MKYFFVISLLLVVKVGATEEALSLKRAQEIALKNHPEILSAHYDTEAAKEAVKEANANYLPQVGANAIRAFSNNVARISAGPGISNPLILNRASVGVSTTQLITDFGRTGYYVSSAQAALEASTARSLSARDQVLFRVTRAYYNVLRAQKIVHVAEKTQKARQLLFDQIKALREADLRSDLDTSIAHQLMDEANLLMLKAQNALDAAQADLSQELGYDDTKQFSLMDDTKVEAILSNFKELLRKAKKQNPQLNALRADLQAAHDHYLAEKAANYPSINAFGYVGQNPLRDKTKLAANYSAAGINLSAPIYTGGRLTAAENKALYQKKAIREALVGKKNQLVRDVRVVLNDTQTAYSNIKATQELWENSTKALELTQERYTVGKNSIVDLAQAQLSQTQAEIAYSNAKYDYLISRALLEFHVGTSI